MYARASRGPVIPAPPPKAARAAKKGFPWGIAIGLVVAAGTIVAILALVVFPDSGDSKGGKKSKRKDKTAQEDDDGSKSKSKSKKDEYSAAAEPAIPPSVSDGRVDPKELSRGEGRAVKPDAKEVDLANTISYSADSDPYCKDQARFTDILKEVGYNIDRELRSTSTISEAEEMTIGDAAFQEVTNAKEFRGKIDTPAMAEYRRYIAELAVPLLVSVERKNMVYKFHTIDDPTMNAFAIPGGHIFFFRGILEKPRRIENEAQLAGVLAHEINHVDKRHTIAIFEHLKRIGATSRTGEEIGRIVVAMARHPFSTTQEDEADTMAVKFLINAEYSPKQFVTMWQTWAELENKGRRNQPVDPLEAELEGLLATHSRPERRACNAMRVTMLDKKAEVERYYVGSTNYKQRTTRARRQY